MSHSHSHENTVPRPALYLAMGLVVTCLGLTAAVSFGFADRASVPSVERAQANITAVETRRLNFLDQDDGAVAVVDADSGETVMTLIGEQSGSGFVRGVMRGLARERRMHGIGSSPPFELTLWGNGSISLVDSATGRSIELGGFGPDNRETFAQFLKGYRA